MADSASGSSGPKLLVAIDIHFFLLFDSGRAIALSFVLSFEIRGSSRRSVRDVSRLRRTETRSRRDYSGKQRKKVALRASKIGIFFAAPCFVKAISRKRARV